ncbi:MAG: hypothetical protein LC624_08220, partial [Halobacteriales archaeon]|nr:hypothetical protein [Halobacteriales archaeon]
RVLLTLAALSMAIALAPVHAAAPSAVPEGWTIHATPSGVFATPGLPVGDSTVACEGDAPFENSCHLDCVCPAGVEYIFGWQAPSGWLGTPVGTAEMSTVVLLRGENGGQYNFECDWGINPAGSFVPGMIRCAITGFNGILPGGRMSIDMHAGVMDPQALNAGLPSLNGVEAGVGHWQFLVDC